MTMFCMCCSWLVLRPGLSGLVTSGGGGFTSCGGSGFVSADMMVAAEDERSSQEGLNVAFLVISGGFCSLCLSSY